MEFFTEKQITDIRECFNLYSRDGIVHSVPQLRCILRSLGYSTTVSKTIMYFGNRRSIDFASFLDITKEEHNSGDHLLEVIKALRILDRGRTQSISISEFRSILTSVGERMSREEIDNILKQIAARDVIPHRDLTQYISK
ncbi:hypothetical protein DICVIV_09298 [Dictyocaulus viviparus]|uniref:EF-hand domain-containing protein n=1 Tax=Dictyocaulus viviparus TaxID=29172 RepID=A0A0D8XQK5_DICVI|nr:hypothetical protein DICVIV_09298 [Dictyocaulus viviparus]